MVDREQAGRFGADVTAVGSAIQLVTNGMLIGDYRPDDADDEVDIRARFPDADRNLEQLDRLRVNTRARLDADRQLRHAHAGAAGRRSSSASTASAC